MTSGGSRHIAEKSEAAESCGFNSGAAGPSLVTY
jgi:hypothetical protein